MRENGINWGEGIWERRGWGGTIWPFYFSIHSLLVLMNTSYNVGVLSLQTPPPQPQGRGGGKEYLIDCIHGWGGGWGQAALILHAWFPKSTQFRLNCSRPIYSAPMQRSLESVIPRQILYHFSLNYSQDHSCKEKINLTNFLITDLCRFMTSPSQQLVHFFSSRPYYSPEHFNPLKCHSSSQWSKRLPHYILTTHLWYGGS